MNDANNLMAYFLPAQQSVGVDASVSEPYYTNLDTTPGDNSNDNYSMAPPQNSAESEKTDGRKARRKGTNLYGRPYCPGRPLSMEERTRIIDLHMNGMKVNAISKALCISHGCVSKIISRYRSTGILSPASSPEQRKIRRKRGAKPVSPSPEEYKTDYVRPEMSGYENTQQMHYIPSPPDVPMHPMSYPLVHPYIVQDHHQHHIMHEYQHHILL